FYLLRGGPDDVVLDSRDGNTANLPGPAPGVGANPFDTFYEIPIAIQDRSFNADGSLFYPDNRAFFEGLNVPPTAPYLDIPYIAEEACDGLPSDVSPIWNPEFFGNMMVVNGFTWPFLEVEQRRYRFRLLNGCNSRFLLLDFSDAPGIEVWQIGAEGGFLPAPVNLSAENSSQALMAPAERADIIVDFTNVPTGSYLLRNLAPDEPFGGGAPGDAFEPADPDSTGQVLEFRVVPSASADSTTPPMYLRLPEISSLGEADKVRYLTLNEEESATVRVSEDESGNVILDCAEGEPFGPVAALLGTQDTGSETPTPLLWSDPITENPAVAATEVWDMYNFTEDAHPIHIHLVQFEVLEREVLNESSPHYPQFDVGAVVPREAWETGPKDTVIAYPGEITRVKARFDLPGFYVWHCHIVEHEDNEMMRPYHVGPIPPDAPAQ
ncbi:MAG TPA: multicopper oxidase domain-containing protein, partial [Candidatus Sulfomarinibacteraceae bacterium]|nr:multicopper oxidase domain-containing protein [Candidatus Sulfomarinibacteraceae bacterium]